MKKQIVYCKFIPRLFSIMLDLIVISAFLPIIGQLITEHIIIGLFKSFLFNSEILKNNSNFNIMQLTIDATIYKNIWCIITFLFITVFLYITIIGAYFVICWHKFNASIGKIFLRMRVVDADDFSTPSIYRLIKRFLGYFVTPLGMWSVITNKRNMAFHDKIANTIVIQK